MRKSGVWPVLTGAGTQVTISKDDTIVLDGAGDKSAITDRCDQIGESIKLSTSDYDRCAGQGRALQRGCALLLRLPHAGKPRRQ